MGTLTCNEWCLLPPRKVNLSIIAQRIEVIGEKTQKGPHLNGLYIKIFRYSELLPKSVPDRRSLLSLVPLT
jgi:hypothetical protein